MSASLSIAAFALCVSACAAESVPPPRIEMQALNARGVSMNNYEMQMDAPQPDPKLAPEQVIAIQLEALQKNDAKDSGIRIAFRFASPSNKEMTGPIERFILLVKNPAYSPMLNYKKAERDAIIVSDDVARQRVVLTTENGERAIYIFTLSKQKSGEFKDCWMTDGVERVDTRPDPRTPVALTDGANGYYPLRA